VRVPGIGTSVAALTTLTAAGALLFGGVAFAHDESDEGASGHHGDSSAHCKRHLGLNMLGKDPAQCETRSGRGSGNARGNDGQPGGDGPYGEAGQDGTNDTNNSTAGRNDY
jgi:hypothetical protein